MTVDLPRETALKVLCDINEKGAYTGIDLNRRLDARELRNIDTAFITELVYGCVKWRMTLDWVIEQFSSVKLKKISPWVMNILRLGVYQLLYMDKVPDSAACNESVKLSRRYGHDAASGFVNAVLRNVSRNKTGIRYPDRESDIENYLAVRYSHPKWMVSEWLGRYGKEFTEALLKSNNEIPDFTVRANTLKTTPEELIKELERAGIEAVEGRYVPEAVIIRSPGPLPAMEAFRKGLLQVQDESSMLVSRILDPKPGELVLDVCAAPGGKASHIAQLMHDEGRVVARDIREHRIRLVNEVKERLGIRIISAEVFDAETFDEDYAEKADRVLVDAPCTGLGILRRKPDIKWTRKPEDIKNLAALQSRMLEVSSRYVKRGGVIAYSTCTVMKEENEDVVKGFLEKRDDFRAADISATVPAELQRPSLKDGYIRLFPNVEGVDGFFIAKLQRTQ